MSHDDRSPKPQTVIFSKGYNPQLSEGAAVPPVFRTSTFVFRTAEEGKRAFEIAYGLKPAAAGESPALIYTRVNNPNAEMVEDRVTAWDGMEAAALASSGMGAISATCLTFLRPGDTLIFSDPVYGGTELFFRHVLPQFQIKTIPFPAGSTPDVMAALVRDDPTVKVIYIESPANPTNVLTDIAAAAEIKRRYSSPERPILLMVDNTFMGPIFIQPKALGADIVLYSATKFIGGHSDLVAGLALGSKELIGKVKVTRTVLGSNSDPDTAWLILRSLGTLQLRMDHQQDNARVLARFLEEHPKVRSVAYPGSPEMGAYQTELFHKMCRGQGSIITFRIKGGEEEAFRLLNAVREFRLAVSLGGIESLIEHPASMTHSDMTPEEQRTAGIGPDMIRVSVGLEHVDDLVEDMRRALEAV